MDEICPFQAIVCSRTCALWVDGCCSLYQIGKLCVEEMARRQNRSDKKSDEIIREHRRQVKG